MDEKEMPYALTDFGNARRFVTEHGHSVRFVADRKLWLVWDGNRWRVDDALEVERLAKATIYGLMDTAKSGSRLGSRELKFAEGSQNPRRLAAMLEAAKSESEIVITSRALDSHPWLLNVENGTIDLRTGALTPADPANLITKMIPLAFDGAKHSEVWQEFLTEVSGHNDELSRFLQRLIGYAISGVANEDVFTMIIGPGGTGKTTFIEAVKAMMGPYAMSADFETFRRSQKGIRNDIARLVGARLVTGSEVRRGDRLDEQVVKQLTGGDRITSRLLYEEFEEFKPQFTVVIVANHRPHFDTDDSGLLRRLIEIPFVKVMMEPDRCLKDRLSGERDIQEAILAWAVQGCVEWQRQGLQPPAAVRPDFTSTQSLDAVGAFIAACCECHPKLWVHRGDVWSQFESWSIVTMGRVSMSKADFYSEMRAKNFTDTKQSGRDAFRGLRLKETA